MIIFIGGLFWATAYFYTLGILVLMFLNKCPLYKYKSKI